MSNPVVQYGSFGAILLRMQSMLVSALGLDASACIITVLDANEVPHLASQQDLLLRVMGERPDTEIIDGSGRVDNRRFRTVQIVLRTRLNLDIIGQDLQRLTEASLGHIGIEDTICDNLECLFVEDASGNNLLISPLRLGTLTATQRDSTHKQKGWVWSGWDCEVHYARSLDLTKGY